MLFARNYDFAKLREFALQIGIVRAFVASVNVQCVEDLLFICLRVLLQQVVQAGDTSTLRSFSFLSSSGEEPSGDIDFVCNESVITQVAISFNHCDCSP